MRNHLTSRQIWSIGIATIVIGLSLVFVWDKFSSPTVINLPRSDDSKSSVPPEKYGSTSLWFEQSFWDGKNKMHAIFTETPRLNEDGTVVSCHVCGTTIGVVTYKQVAGQWEFISIYPKVAELGQWGSAPEVQKAKVLQLASDNVALLIRESERHQGYYGEGIHLLAYSKNNWHHLGYVGTEDNNSGTCYDTPHPSKNDMDFGLNRCWGYKGEVSIKTGDNSKYPDLLVTETGTEESEDALRLVPVNRVITYIFNGEKYIDPKTERNVSE